MIVTAEHYGIIGAWNNGGFDGEADQGVARWVCAYRENPDLRLEKIQSDRRKTSLLDLFKRRKIPLPVVILGYGLDSLSPPTLEVFSVYTPEVDESMLRPIVELRLRAPTLEEAQEELIRKVLRAGAVSIRDVYASAIGPEGERE